MSLGRSEEPFRERGVLQWAIAMQVQEAGSLVTALNPNPELSRGPKSWCLYMFGVPFGGG